MMNKANKSHPQQARKSGVSPWKAVALCMIIVILPWAFYVNFHPRFDSLGHVTIDGAQPTSPDTQLRPGTQPITPGVPVSVKPIENVVSRPAPAAVKKLEFPDLPVQGPIPTNGAVPLFGVQHKGTDAIMALACNYPTIYYKRFVGSLRKFGYTEDIVLAVSPVEKMKPGVEAYVKETGVVAYGFDVDCKGTDNCQLQTNFLGYPDPRPMRTFANIRYALYEYWLRHYSDNSYVLILDFRDTFFQANPFAQYGDFNKLVQPKYDLQMYAENYKVRNVSSSAPTSKWIETCISKSALDALSHQPAVSSGSVLGSFSAVKHYVRTMLASMDTIQCWATGYESDQGYQNYLFYNGHFNTAMGNATLFHQGYGVVNTIGAMNGYRVPKDQKGPLDTFWKIRDKEGYVLNYDGTRSACVHQWDRWFDELAKFIDANLF